MRHFARNRVLKWVASKGVNANDVEQLQGVFKRSTSRWRSVFQKLPSGWGKRVKRRLDKVIGDTDRFVQMLNDRYANPSGVKTAMPTSHAQDGKTN
jgi:hypothetical protein